MGESRAQPFSRGHHNTQNAKMLVLTVPWGLMRGSLPTGGVLKVAYYLMVPLTSIPGSWMQLTFFQWKEKLQWEKGLNSKVKLIWWAQCRSLSSDMKRAFKSIHRQCFPKNVCSQFSTCDCPVTPSSILPLLTPLHSHIHRKCVYIYYYRCTQRIIFSSFQFTHIHRQYRHSVWLVIYVYTHTHNLSFNLVLSLFPPNTCILRLCMYALYIDVCVCVCACVYSLPPVMHVHNVQCMCVSVCIPF